MKVKKVCERLGLPIWGIWDEVKKDFVRDKWGLMITSFSRSYLLAFVKKRRKDESNRKN